MNRSNTPKPTLDFHQAKFLLGICLVAAQAARLCAQTETPNSAESDKAIQLSPFDVSSRWDTGYQATNSMSGTRVNMNLIDLPQTISVLTADFINDIGVTNVDAALRYASSVTTDNFWSGMYSVRGFDIGQPLLNGHPFASYYAMDSANVERVEIVKGPASALYGVGTPGGVVNIISKPASDIPTEEVDARVDSLGSVRGVVAIGGPLTIAPLSGDQSEISYRASFIGQRTVSSLQNGKRESYEFAPTIKWIWLPKSSHPTTLTVAWDFLTVPDMVSADERYPQVDQLEPAPTSSSPSRSIYMATGYVPGLPWNFVIEGPNARRHDENQFLDIDLLHQFTSNISNRVTFSDSELHIRRLTQFVDGNIIPNADGSIPAVVGDEVWRITNDFWNQQLRDDLNINQDLPWANKMNVVVGYQYNRFTNHAIEWENLNKNTINLFNPGAADYDLGQYPADFTKFYDQLSHQDTALANAVGSLSILKDRLNIVGGASRSYILASSVVGPALNTFTPPPPSLGTTVTNSFQAGQAAINSQTPRINGKILYYDADQIGATVKVTHNVTAYYSQSQSVKSNGASFPLNPQSGSGKEGGLRFQFLGGRLSGDMAYFDIVLTNVPHSDPNRPGVQVLTGESRSQGFETDWFYSITNGLQLVLNYTNMQPHIVSNIQAPVTQGNLIDSAYPREFNSYLRYTLQSGSLKGMYTAVGVNYRSVSKPFGSTESLYRLTNPPFTLWNYYIGYAWTDGQRRHWDARAEIENLFDKHYITNTAIPGAGLTASWSISLKM